MKIVYCIPDTFRPGGIERMLSIKASYLAESNNGKEHEIYIITTGQNGKDNYYTFSSKIRFIDLGINYDEALPLPFLKRFLLRRKKRSEHKICLEKTLKSIAADIVISTFTHESAFLPSIKDGSKKILEFHFSKGYKIKHAKKDNESFYLKAAHYYLSFIEEYITAPKYDAFVVLTEEDKKNWRSRVPDVRAIPNILSVNPEQKAKLENHIALAVGRLTSQKGFDKLIKLWSTIKKKYPGWQLHIVGSGEDEDLLNTLINKYELQEQVLIYPPDKNIVLRYLESSIFVMTSRYEGFPMVLLEAMGCGLPCISYNYPHGPSEIIHTNEDGFLIKNDDENSFLMKISELMQSKSLRARLGENASINIKRYSTEMVMKKWISLFHEIKNETK